MLLPGNRIVQNGWVVTNLEAGIERWRATLGVGPFFVVKGRRVALAHSGGLQIELIEHPGADEAHIADIVPAGREGLHHIAVKSDDFERDTAHYARGLVRTGGGEVRGMRYGFFDARPALGCMLEVLEWVDWIRERAEMIEATCEAWDGRGELIRHV
jgi:hypothetical protein